MINPKISIITITYNSEKTLEETIQSVITQEYNNLEYLIIDGGSKDKTLEIVDKYRDKISFVISEPDKGISDAFNKGIKYATGEIIGIINSDDILCKDALSILASNYNPDIDVYRGQCIVWNSDSNVEKIDIPTIQYSVYKLSSHVCHPSTFIRKSSYERWGGYSIDLKYMMDADILYRFYANKAKFVYVDKPLAKFRIGGVTSQNWGKKVKEKFCVLRRNGCNILGCFLGTAFFVCKQIAKTILMK